jgi:hypothetical protein
MGRCEAPVIRTFDICTTDVLQYGMSNNISLRINDDELETLDRLVVACRAYYNGSDIPVVKQLARNVTRSSALRDLLLAWKHGCVEQFDPALTEPPAGSKRVKPMTFRED